MSRWPKIKEAEAVEEEFRQAEENRHQELPADQDQVLVLVLLSLLIRFQKLYLN